MNKLLSAPGDAPELRSEAAAFTLDRLLVFPFCFCLFLFFFFFFWAMSKSVGLLKTFVWVQALDSCLALRLLLRG